MQYNRKKELSFTFEAIPGLAAAASVILNKSGGVDEETANSVFETFKKKVAEQYRSGNKEVIGAVEYLKFAQAGDDYIPPILENLILESF